MKDIFDECQFADFNLKSRIVRTGGWERRVKMEDLSKPLFLTDMKILPKAVLD
ncbi:MAG: hypothetical protein Q4P11_06665 [Methanobrevibacter sp.]|nr:hypothetical protein [Methanobrevibacter sp.]